jgi:hypothetical protein
MTAGPRIRMLASALLALVASSVTSAGAQQVQLELARGGRTSYVISADASTGETGRFAARELSSYLGRISGAVFRVSSTSGARRVILLSVEPRPSFDDYSIEVRGDTIALTGSTPRAALYASYDLLERLGCRWIAPKLAFYTKTEAEVVPRRRTLVYRGPKIVEEHPTFAARKINVEEGLSHDVASLRAMADWMAKSRFNLISFPINYGGAGRVFWANWRREITPALKLRGIAIEVGGHGYQNFLNARMEGAGLFQAHPDWFGRDSSCAPSRAPEDVFNTSNPDAVSFVSAQAVRYMAGHREVDILEFWPPDGARWSACPDDRAESAPDRHATLLNTISRQLRVARPDALLQTIAYAEAQDPPSRVKLDERIMVDVCPIRQNFDYQIDDPRAPNNAQYATLIRNWRSSFAGHLSLYSYFRRYAWLSLPVIMPHFMQHDMKWYASIPLQGISSYAEPGDWYTYELNHYVFARLAWKPGVDVDSLTSEYVVLRYGRQRNTAAAAYRTMEDVVRRYGSLQYTTPKAPADIAAARQRIDAARRALSGSSPGVKRLRLMMEFASRDLAIQERRVAGDTTAMRPLIEDVVRFVTANGDKGVFVLTQRNDRARIYRHYGLRADG